MAYNTWTRSVLAALELESGRLPVEGMTEHWVLGFLKVWITPLPPRPAGMRHKRSTHRLLCTCPSCGVTISVGRLHQHEDTAACREAQEDGTLVDRIKSTNANACADCGKAGERTGHQGCPFPQNH